MTVQLEARQSDLFTLFSFSTQKLGYTSYQHNIDTFSETKTLQKRTEGAITKQKIETKSIVQRKKEKHNDAGQATPLKNSSLQIRSCMHRAHAEQFHC